MGLNDFAFAVGCILRLQLGIMLRFSNAGTKFMVYAFENGFAVAMKAANRRYSVNNHLTMTFPGRGCVQTFTGTGEVSLSFRLPIDFAENLFGNFPPCFDFGRR